MGLILDTSFLVEKERRRESATAILRGLQADRGNADAGISTVTAVELTHGIHRARSEDHRARRRIFAAEVFEMLIVYPLTLEIAQLAGRIEGEQAAKGNLIPFEDLIIGATALHLGFDVATLNVRHFERIPGLKIVSL
ncbi:MAG TPA: PIN domain-containing protein [Bryobacteraceae bacterium]|nr:PIN domain-containing protein [Bryobacteraceae bacterium]